MKIAADFHPGCASFFDLWAPVYDTQLNPLVALEERMLAPLLPANAAHILDVGCGTGRWLKYFEPHHPASLTGIDRSARMLEQARTKLVDTTILYQADGAALPNQEASQDLVLASFVVSYVADLDRFTSECKRVLQAGRTLLLTDMHPETARQRNWKRSFHVDGRNVEIPVADRSLEAIIDACVRCGFEVEDLTEPSFGAPEQAIFQQAGRVDDYLSLQTFPAIYILESKKTTRRFA